MVEISYHKFLKVTGMSEETFKATSIERKKKSLLKQGFEVQSIKGRGVKAIFYCKENLLSKQKNEVQSILGVDTKHPDVMLRYLELMKDEENLYKSDFQLAKEVFNEFNYDLQTLKKYFCICRLELIDLGWMKPTVTDKRDRCCSKRKYFIKFDNGEIQSISSDEFLDNYKMFYYEELNKSKREYCSVNNTSTIDEATLRFLQSRAKENMRNVIGGNMFVTYKREFKYGGFKD